MVYPGLEAIEVDDESGLARASIARAGDGRIVAIQWYERARAALEPQPYIGEYPPVDGDRGMHIGSRTCQQRCHSCLVDAQVNTVHRSQPEEIVKQIAAGSISACPVIPQDHRQGQPAIVGRTSRGGTGGDMAWQAARCQRIPGGEDQA